MSRFVSAGRTDVGKLRRRNEDAVLVRDEVGLWAVADGIGGHAAGDFACAMIVERLGALARTGSGLAFVEAIEDALVQVNADLLDNAAARGVDLVGSTVVVLVAAEQRFYCGWAGDSRVYRFEAGRLVRLTRDHVHGSGNDGAGTAPLTRAVGVTKELRLDWVVADDRAGAQFLLCSDGLNKEMSDEELAAEFRRGLKPAALVDTLFETALRRGARDNVSAIVVSLI